MTQQTVFEINEGEIAELCRSTPEGYLIKIEERQFLNKDGEKVMEILKKPIIDKGQDDKSNQAFIKNLLSKDVEQVFKRICSSMEVYKIENIPIITEFLEF